MNLLKIVICLLIGLNGNRIEALQDESDVSITTIATETVSTTERSEEDRITVTSVKEDDETTEAPDDDSDPWADVEDDDGASASSGSANFDIVDTMRSIRENNLNVPYRPTSTNLNETFDKIGKAWEIIETYYLPQRKTWEKLLGLVTGLDVDVSPECFSSYFQGVSAFRTYSMWAYRFLDVRGRFPESGTLHGQFSSFGEYDECLTLESPQNSATGLIVKGQYCLLEVKLPYPPLDAHNITQLVDLNHPFVRTARRYLRNFRLHNWNTPYKMAEALQMFNGTVFRTGICMPSMCKAHEIERLAINLTYPIFNIPLQVGPKCYKLDDRTQLERHQVWAITALALLTLWMTFCTAIEWYNKKYDREIAKINKKLGMLMFHRDVAFKPSPFLYSFSAITNTNTLFRHDKSTSSFASLDTIRMFMILYIHLSNYYNYLGTVGLVTLKRIFTTFPVLGFRDDRYAFTRISLPYDTIFIISGIIIGFNLHKTLKKTENTFSYVRYCFKLWIKFAVTYGGSILFLMVLPVMARGPIWEYGMRWLSGCLHWKVVLNGFFFISNFNEQMNVINPRTTVLPYCNPPTWFTSILLQLLLLAPLIVYLYYNSSRRLKYFYCAILALVSLGLTLLPYFAFQIKPEVHFLELETLHETFISYAWYRYGTNSYFLCFLSGLLGGFMLTKVNVLFRMEIEQTLLVVCVVIIQVIIAINNSFWRLDKSPPLVKSLLWYSLGRMIICICLTYAFYMIASNRASAIQRFLEWYPFKVMSRLSYSYFMVHILVIFYRIFAVKDVYVMHDYQMMQNYVIDVMLTFILSYIFYCIIECPVVNLMNLMQGRIFYDVDRYDHKSSEPSAREEKDKNDNLENGDLPENIIIDSPPDSLSTQGVSNQAFELGETGSDNWKHVHEKADQQSLGGEEEMSSRL